MGEKGLKMIEHFYPIIFSIIFHRQNAYHFILVKIRLKMIVAYHFDLADFSKIFDKFAYIVI